MYKETQILDVHLETPRACFAENALCPELPQALFGKRNVYCISIFLTQVLKIDGKFWKMPHSFHPSQVGSFQTPRVSVKQQTG